MVTLGRLLGDSLGFSIKRAQVRAYDAYFRTVGAAGLTPARLSALTLIGEGASISQIDLATRLKVSGPNMVKVIDTLEEQGLVARQADANDRRRYALALTDEGKIRLAQIRDLVQVYEAQIASRLSAHERKQLMRLLEKVAIDGA